MTALLQTRVAATADQLKRLADELDLADPAGPSLMLSSMPCAAARVDGELHAADLLDRGVVEVAAEHERLEALEQLVAVAHVAGHATPP